MADQLLTAAMVHVFAMVGFLLVLGALWIALRSRLERTGSKSGEWLMGLPEGWTGLKPLGMDKFHEWLQEHSENYMPVLAADAA